MTVERPVRITFCSGDEGSVGIVRPRKYDPPLLWDAVIPRSDPEYAEPSVGRSFISQTFRTPSMMRSVVTPPSSPLAAKEKSPVGESFADGALVLPQVLSVAPGPPRPTGAILWLPFLVDHAESAIVHSLTIRLTTARPNRCLNVEPTVPRVAGNR